MGEAFYVDLVWEGKWGNVYKKRIELAEFSAYSILFLVTVIDLRRRLLHPNYCSLGDLDQIRLLF